MGPRSGPRSAPETCYLRGMTVPQKSAVRNKQKRRRTKKLAEWRAKKAAQAAKSDKK